MLEGRTKNMKLKLVHFFHIILAVIIVALAICDFQTTALYKHEVSTNQQLKTEYSKVKAENDGLLQYNNKLESAVSDASGKVQELADRLQQLETKYQQLEGTVNKIK
jgi:predicted nuclease with TOPRIM domain